VSSDPRAAADSRQTILSQIRVLVSQLHRSARAVERKTGITNAQLYLLRQLDGVDGLSVNDLAARARTSQSTASILAKRLVTAGLVSRAKSTTDGRSTILSLTTSGRRMLRKAPPPPTQSLFDGLDALTDTEARTLAKALRPLIKKLHLESETPTLLFEE
jgi:DNA-binding MarR family transcriptional regulator